MFVVGDKVMLNTQKQNFDPGFYMREGLVINQVYTVIEVNGTILRVDGNPASGLFYRHETWVYAPAVAGDSLLKTSDTKPEIDWFEINKEFA